MSLFLRRVLAFTVLALGVLPVASSRLAAQSGSISGKVTDAATGRPIENAQVQAQLSGGQAYGAISGTDGTFRVVNLPDGSYTVTVRAIGYDQKVFNGQRPGATITAALSERPTQLNQTVVTASRSRPEKALDAPAQISVVSSERIEERPAVTVTDHLRSTPGVDISRGGIAQSNVVARGFNNAFSGAMLMLQDYRFAGVPSLRVNVPFMFTGTNEDIDRMEVLLGPASALYGPNSSNGVLHVITKSPFASQGTTISVDGGERSVMRAGIRHASKLNEKFAVKVSGEYMRGKDWEFLELAEPATFPTTDDVPASRRGKTNDRDFSLERYTGEARMDIRPSENSEAITTVGHTHIGHGIEYTGANGAAQIRNWTYTSLQQRFRWNRLFAQVFANLSNAGNDNALSDEGTYLLRSGKPIVDKSNVWAAQLQHGFDMGSKQSFTYGADYIATNPETGNTINGGNEDNDNVREYGAYLQSSTRPNKHLELLLAARGDANNVIDGAFFSPRAAIIFKPTETQNIRFTYNRAFSTPANFSFFLDLIQTPNVGGSGFNVYARGNPPKEGHLFNRSCTSNSTFGSFCMKSAYTGQGQFTGASAAAAFPGAITALGPRLIPGIASGLARLSAAGMTPAQIQALAAGAVQYLASRAPTNADLATRVTYLTNASTPGGLTPDQLTDIAPLSASFNNTFEVGYKGIVGNRFRWDISLWGQERGDVGTTAALSTPNVMFANPQQVGGYLGQQLGAYFGQQLGPLGVPAEMIGQIASGLATALTPNVAALPVGVVTWANSNTAPNAIYATYLTTPGKIWVRGMDLATDIVATDRLTFDLAYSWQSENVFGGIAGGNNLPLMSNSPKSRGSVGMRYRNEGNGLGFELRSRYNDAYPVNSSVHTTNFAFAIASGRPGAAANPTIGADKCAPVSAGAYCYDGVPEAVVFDAQVSKHFDLGGKQKLMWSISAQNMFDNQVRTFPGMPQMGRMVMSRLQYSF